MLLGLLVPSEGAVELFGAVPSVSGRRRVGYVPQSLGLYDDLTVQENWAFTTTAFSLTDAPQPEAILAWREVLVGDLPLGAQRRVAFAVVVLSHRPELLVLDEPTSGVGPLNGAVWQEIRRAADGGAGAIVTTHSMEEAVQCDRLVVMSDGAVVMSGTAAEIVGDRTVLEVRCDDWREAFRTLDAKGFAVAADGKGLLVAASAESVSEILAGTGIDSAIRLVPANLEEAFVVVVARAASR